MLQVIIEDRQIKATPTLQAPPTSYLQQDIIHSDKLFWFTCFPRGTLSRSHTPMTTPTPALHGGDEQEVPVDGMSELCVCEVVHDRAKVLDLGLCLCSTLLLQESLQ